MILYLTAAVRVHKDRELSTVLDKPLHHRLKLFWEYEYRPVGYGEGASGWEIWIQNAGDIIVEEVMAVGAQHRGELRPELVTDHVGIADLLLVDMQVEQVKVVGEDLGWGRVNAGLVSLHSMVVGGVSQGWDCEQGS